MKRNVNDFIEEITTNFGELFVETFFIRYFNEFDKNDLLSAIPDLKNMLLKKIDNNLKKSLVGMGYDKKEIEKIFKQKEA
ncbi:MAG: hypothetical protein IJN13_01510 [Bacilli bacterium]|nr:hypothetical protein [Bacilli bacterium]